MKRLSASALFLTVLLFSCKKDNDPTPPPPVGSMNINLLIAPNTLNEEIIISESNGKVLLDTVARIKTSLVATLRTNETLLDFTDIGYDTASDRYIITTYKGVDPSRWVSMFRTDYAIPIDPLPSRRAAMYYKNVPPVSFAYLRLSDFISSGSDSWVTGPGTLSLKYTQHGSNNYLYTLFPLSGLYNFHIPQGLDDTIDLAHIDTAVMLNFNKASDYTMQPTNLFGFMDTTDFSKIVWLWSGPSTTSGLPDVEYPKKLVQKYELFASATNNNRGYAQYYSYADSVPSTLPFPDESFYSLSASQYNNFSVSFHGAHPSYYSTIWNQSNKINWRIFASPDSTSLNPQKLLSSLNSITLRGKDVSNLALTSFQFENVKGMDYAGFFTYEHDPAQVRSKRVITAASFNKGF